MSSALHEPSAGASNASISDVASLAGVSQGTVSNVLNHPERVTTTTLERVQRAIQMLKYVPNGPARSLAVGRTPSFGLVLSDLSNSLFVQIAAGAERAAEEAGLTLLLANSDGRLDRENTYVRLFAEGRVAGVLLTLNDESHYRAIAQRASPGGPLVLLNYAADPASFCSAHIRNDVGGHMAARHLIETGRRRLAFIGGPSGLQPVTERRLGFHRALTEHGLQPALEIDPIGVNRSDGWTVGLRLVDDVRAGLVDGVFASSDLLAAGIAQAFAANDVSVPAQVGIVGYDNNQAAWDSPIPITTIGQPGDELGYRGAQLLLREVAASDTHRHEQVELEPTLIVRESTGAAAAVDAAGVR